jgi:hypothetical protein
MGRPTIRVLSVTVVLRTMQSELTALGRSPRATHPLERWLAPLLSLFVTPSSAPAAVKPAE